jgi:S1-C subfamily serine protease
MIALRSMRLVMLRVGCLILLLTSVFQATGQDATVTVKKILPSLALIVATTDSPNAELGTGFCFWSTPTKSYVLTNRHVIEGAKEILVRPQGTSEFTQQKIFYKGRAYPVKGPYADPGHLRLPEDQDLRVVVIDVGNTPRVTLSFREPELGQPIGIAGFPSFQFEVAGAADGATPSVHFGSVNSFPESRYI